MTIDALLGQLRRRNITVSVEGDRLRCTAPKGALTAEIRDALAEHRSAVIALLSTKAALPPLRRAARNGPPPLSFAQERLWFLHHMEAESSAYNIVTAIRFQTGLNVRALEQALSAVMRRHEVLRTVFPAIDGIPQARLGDPVDVRLPIVDLRTLTPLEQEREVDRIKRERGSEPFDLETGPLWRCTLLQSAATDWELLIVQHHIVTDRWSLGLLLNEIQTHYARLTGGSRSAPADLDLQYSDFAAWQRESAEALAEQLAYWRSRLAGPLPILELATDRPRPALQTFNGAWEQRRLSSPLTGGLRRLSQQEGATLFMTLLTAFETLLFRHTGVDDVLVGSPVAGRNREELAPIIGCFINTVVLRTDLSGNPTFRELLQRVRDTALEAFARQDIPFERIIADLRLPRDLSRPPVFQTVFTMQTAPKGVEVTSDMTFTASGGTMFDLMLTAVEIADGLHLTAEYNTDLFDQRTMARLLAQLETLLVAVTLNPELRLQEIPILSAADRAEMPLRSSGPARPYPLDMTVTDLVRAQRNATPEAVAVSGGGEAMTYAALLARSAQVAAQLRARGMTRGARVGVCVDRTPAMVAALLGIWEAGAAYVPLDPAFPSDRLAFMLRDAAVRVVISDAASRASVPAQAEDVLLLDAATAWEAVPPSTVDWRARPGDLAYVIYTSGSTGWPKGVEIPHQAVVNFLTSMADAPGLTSSDVLLAVTTLSFDIAGLELWLPLTVGGRVELVSRDEASDGRLLGARLAACSATVLQATPATWRLLLEAAWVNAARVRMLCGGEALPPELADRLLAGGGALWNLYGPTETTIWSTVDEVRPGEAITIGRPIGNTQAYVLDGAGQPVPLGVLGELYLGGDGIAIGYHGRAALTAERFVPDPYGGRPGTRLYRTGDLARWLPDGRLQCLGRIDHQVKVRGFRIELGEIEAALAAQPTVQHAAVTVQPDLGGEPRLVAYVVSRGANATASELRTALRRLLPDYMVPSMFIDLEALPLTANLKIDRRALPPVFVSTPVSERHIEPKTPAEQTIAGIWETVIGIERVSADANFFDVGGHSLLAMRVLARIEERFGLRLGPRVLMLDTLAQIAARCDRQRLNDEAGGGVAPTAAAGSLASA